MGLLLVPLAFFLIFCIAKHMFLLPESRAASGHSHVDSNLVYFFFFFFFSQKTCSYLTAGTDGSRVDTAGFGLPFLFRSKWQGINLPGLLALDTESADGKYLTLRGSLYPPERRSCRSSERQIVVFMMSLVI